MDYSAVREDKQRNVPSIRYRSIRNGASVRFAKTKVAIITNRPPALGGGDGRQDITWLQQRQEICHALENKIGLSLGIRARGNGSLSREHQESLQADFLRTTNV